MKKLSQFDFNRVYKEHQDWIWYNEIKGTRAYFTSMDLSEISFPQPTILKGACMQNIILKD